MKTTAYKEMYLVTKNVYSKVLDCLDQRAREEVEQLNQPCEEETPRRVSEEILGDVSGGDVFHGVEPEGEAIQESEQAVEAEASAQPEITQPLPQLTQSQFPDLFYRPSQRAVDMQTQVFGPESSQTTSDQPMDIEDVPLALRFPKASRAKRRVLASIETQDPDYDDPIDAIRSARRETYGPDIEDMPLAQRFPGRGMRSRIPVPVGSRAPYVIPIRKGQPGGPTTSSVPGSNPAVVIPFSRRETYGPDIEDMPLAQRFPSRGTRRNVSRIPVPIASNQPVVIPFARACIENKKNICSESHKPPFQCTICKKVLTTRFNLTRHMAIYHKTTPSEAERAKATATAAAAVPAAPIAGFSQWSDMETEAMARQRKRGPTREAAAPFVSARRARETNPEPQTKRTFTEWSETD